MSPPVKKSEMYKKINEMNEKLDFIVQYIVKKEGLQKPEKKDGGKAPPVKERKVGKGRTSKKEKTP